MKIFLSLAVLLGTVVPSVQAAPVKAAPKAKLSANRPPLVTSKALSRDAQGNTLLVEWVNLVPPHNRARFNEPHRANESKPETLTYPVYPWPKRKNQPDAENRRIWNLSQGSKTSSQVFEWLRQKGYEDAPLTAKSVQELRAWLKQK